MDINKWISDNATEAGDYRGGDYMVVSVDALNELLETHALVPRKPSAGILKYAGDGFCADKTEGDEWWVDLIEEAEK